MGCRRVCTGRDKFKRSRAANTAFLNNTAGLSPPAPSLTRKDERPVTPLGHTSIPDARGESRARPNNSREAVRLHTYVGFNPNPLPKPTSSRGNQISGLAHAYFGIEFRTWKGDFDELLGWHTIFLRRTALTQRQFHDDTNSSEDLCPLCGIFSGFRTASSG